MLTLLLAKLHVIFVHFPVALVVLSVLAQACAFLRKKAGVDQVARFSIVVGAFSAVMAVASGWLNADSQEYFGKSAEYLFWHRWLGVALAVVMIFSALVSARAAKQNTKLKTLLFSFLLFLALGVVSVTAHLGGLLVHGEDYYQEVYDGFDQLIAELQGKESPVKNKKKTKREHALVLDAKLPEPADRKISFTHDVLPIFKETCAKCHLDGKKKGKLRMDSKELLLEGGESGPALVEGDSRKSLMIQLIAGADPDRIMPSKGRKVTEEELSVLRAWIDQGALWEGEIKSELIPKADYRLKSVQLPANSSFANPIDQILEPELRQRGIDLNKSVNDATYVRRVYFDIVGLPPTDQQLRQFVDSQDPNKREKIVDALLADRPNYAAHWMSYWNDLLRNGYTGPGFLHGGRKETTNWLYSALIRNIPYNQFVAEIIAPSRASQGFVKGILWWENPEDGNPNEHPAMQASQNVAQIFMGINMKCASCHDSFIDSWKLSDAYGLANIYSVDGLETNECNSPLGKVEPAHFVIPELGEIKSESADNIKSLMAEIFNSESDLKRRARLRERLREKIRSERLASLADVATKPENGRLYRNIANRYWGKLMGRAIIEPVDELDYPAWNQDLLDWLAADLIKNNYDLKNLIKTIVTSRAYQLPAVPAVLDPKKFVFKGPQVKRLSAEQVIDSLLTVGKSTAKLGSDELKRLVSLSNSPEYQAVDPQLDQGEARIIYSSPAIGKEADTAEVDVDLTGVSSLWLVAVPVHRVLSELDRQDLEFRLVQLSESESSQLGSESGTVDRTVMSNISEMQTHVYERLKREDEAEIAVWADPRIVGEEGDVYLQSADQIYTANKNDIKRDCTKEQCQLMGEKVDSAIAGFPHSIFGYDLMRLKNKPKRFVARVGLEMKSKYPKHSYRFMLLANMRPRTVFMHSNQLLEALGQPKREQVMSTRSNVGSTMQALEMSNGEILNSLISTVATRLLEESWGSQQELVNFVYSVMLGRLPTEAELALCQNVSNDPGNIEALSDLIWAIVVQPEFQLLA